MLQYIDTKHKETIYLIIALIFLQSCNSLNQSIEEENIPSNTLYILNNNTIQTFDSLTFKINDLQIFLSNQKKLKIQELHIHPASSVSMSIIKEIESICATFLIPRLIYHSNNKTITAHFNPPPNYSNESINFKIDTTGFLFLEETKILKDDNLLKILKEAIDTKSDPAILLTVELGAGYGFYVDHKKRIIMTLAKIDSTLTLENRINNGFYKLEE